MIIAVCDPKGIAIEAIKTILYHDKGLSDRISRINGDHILQMSNYKVLLDTGMTLKGSRKYFSKAKLEFYRGR